MKYSICVLLVFLYITEITSLLSLKKKPTASAPLLALNTTKKPFTAATDNLSSSLSKLLGLTSKASNVKKSSVANAGRSASSITNKNVVPNALAVKSLIPSLQNLLNFGSRSESVSDEESVEVESSILKAESLTPSIPKTDFTISLKQAIPVAPVSDEADLENNGLKDVAVVPQKIRKTIDSEDTERLTTASISTEGIFPEAQLAAVESIKKILPDVRTTVLSVSNAESSPGLDVKPTVLSSLGDAEFQHANKTGTITGHIQDQGIVTASEPAEKSTFKVDPLVPVVEYAVPSTLNNNTPLAVDAHNSDLSVEEIAANNDKVVQDNQLDNLLQGGDLEDVELQEAKIAPKATTGNIVPDRIYTVPPTASPAVPSTPSSTVPYVDNSKLSVQDEGGKNENLKEGDNQDVVIPENIVPETIVPETVVPETVVPETVVPDTIVPETTEALIPENIVEDSTIPKVNTIVPEGIPTEDMHTDTISIEGISAKDAPNVETIDIPELDNDLHKEISLESVQNLGSLLPPTIIPAPIIRINEKKPKYEITVNLPNQRNLFNNFGLNDLTGITMSLSSISGVQAILSTLPSGIPGLISDLSKALTSIPELGDLIIYFLSTLNAILTSISGVTGVPRDNIVASVPGLRLLLDGLLSLPILSTEVLNTVIPSWGEFSLQLLKLETSNPAGLTTLLDLVLNYLGNVLKTIPEHLRGIPIGNILSELPDLIETSRMILSYFDSLGWQYQSIPNVYTPLINIHNNEINLVKIVLG